MLICVDPPDGEFLHGSARVVSRRAIVSPPLTESTWPGDDEVPALSFLDTGPDGLVTRITEFWPGFYEPPAGREHLVERY